MAEPELEELAGDGLVAGLGTFCRTSHGEAGGDVGGADCGLYLVDVLSSFASRAAGGVGDVPVVNLWQGYLVEKADSDKPVAAAMCGTIGIARGAPQDCALPLVDC